MGTQAINPERDLSALGTFIRETPNFLSLQKYKAFCLVASSQFVRAYDTWQVVVLFLSPFGLHFLLRASIPER